MKLKNFFGPTHKKVALFFVLVVVSAFIGTLSFGNTTYYSGSKMVYLNKTEPEYTPTPFIVPYTYDLVHPIFYGPWYCVSTTEGEELPPNWSCGLAWTRPLAKNMILVWIVETLILYSLTCLVMSTYNEHRKVKK